MTSPTPHPPPPSGGNEVFVKAKTEDLNTRFFRYFQKEITGKFRWLSSIYQTRAETLLIVSISSAGTNEPPWDYRSCQW